MKKAVNSIFILCLVIALLLAFGYVAVEIIAVVTANGALTVWAEDNLEAPVCIMCSITSIVAFVMSYVFHWSSGD